MNKLNIAVRSLASSLSLVAPAMIILLLSAGVQADDTNSALNSQLPPSNQSLLDEVKILDHSNSCVTDLQQKMAIQTLKWFKSYQSEDINAVMDLFADDFKVYHSALVRFVVLNPEIAKYLRWGIDPVTRANYRGVLAQLVNGEDQSQPGDSVQEITCGKRNDVVVNANFSGYKVTRDSKTGCITQRVNYGSAVTKTFILDPITLKITINYIDFDGNLADIARAKLAALATQPAIPVVEATCRTAAQTDAQYGVR